MKASRLLSILMLLQARGRLTATALAQAMAVSPRTILRDIDQLSAAGVPLWGERGHQGGFQLREGWSTQLTGMTEPEANALLLAGLPGPATELGLGAAAASARLKLVASLPDGWREQANRVGERLHIDPVDWYRSQDSPQHLRGVADAVWHGRTLGMDYESWRGPARHDIEPLGLVLKAGAWYVVARSQTRGKPREGVLTFRIASILALQAGGRAFRRPKGFDLAQAWRAATERFESSLRPLQARLRVSPRALGWLRNARLPVTVLPEGGDARGWREVLLALESVEHGARQLLGFGPELQVLAPPALRDELLRQAQAVLAVNTPPTHRPRAARCGQAP
jgi:predicted DNA-binding transcriptional regulator YafY